MLIGFKGIPGGASVPPIAEAMLLEARRWGPISMFADWSELRSYASAFRRDWTEWLLGHRREVRELHALVTTRVVEMGLNLVRMAVGEIVHGHTSRTEFESVLHNRLAELDGDHTRPT